MNLIRSTLLFYVIGWIIGYNLIGIPTYLFMLGMEECQEEWVNAAFWPGVMTNVLAGIFIGILLGSIDLLLERMIKKNLSFLGWFGTRTLVYTAIFVGLGAVTQVSLRTLSSGDLQSSVQQTTAGSGVNIMVGYLFFSLVYSILLSFVNQLRRMSRRGILMPLFLGQYYRPRLEQRIFLFLDLKSSTALAERLGNLTYSRLIQDCIHDLDRLVAKYQADIYQYVGDEVVLTWELSRGISRNQCVHIFQAFEEVLAQRAPHYLGAYETVPVFKGGLSAGEVTVTEVGNSKKEISYYGDVLNRAARLQGLANELQSRLLADDHLISLLTDDAKVHPMDKGSHAIRGFKAPVRIFSLVH